MWFHLRRPSHRPPPLRPLCTPSRPLSFVPTNVLPRATGARMTVPAASANAVVSSKLERPLAISAVPHRLFTTLRPRRLHSFPDGHSPESSFPLLFRPSPSWFQRTVIPPHPPALELARPTCFLPCLGHCLDFCAWLPKRRTYTARSLIDS